MVVDGIFWPEAMRAPRGSCSAGTMHGAGHTTGAAIPRSMPPIHGPRRATSRFDGESRRNHRHQSIARDSRRNTCEKTRHEENKESKTQLDRCRALRCIDPSSLANSAAPDESCKRRW